MLKAFDTFQYLCFTFPNLLENYIRHLNFMFSSLHLQHLSENFWKIKDNHTSLFMKMFSPKKNLLKCFVAIQSLIQGFGNSIHFLISSRLVAGMLVLSSIWNYPVGRRKYFSLSSSASARVWVWGIINYSCAEVYLALQYRAIYHRNKCWAHHHCPHLLPFNSYLVNQLDDMSKILIDQKNIWKFSVNLRTLVTF